jgi:hypothetical protein
MTTTENIPDIDGLTAVIDSHLEAYAMADADRRAAIVAAGWNADGELIDPPMTGRGRAEISALADVVVTHYPGHRFRRTTAVDAHHGFARYGWDLVAPDETVAVSGVDFAEFDGSGKLLRVVGFFG